MMFDFHTVTPLPQLGLADHYSLEVDAVLSSALYMVSAPFV